MTERDFFISFMQEFVDVYVTSEAGIYLYTDKNKKKEKKRRKRASEQEKKKAIN